MTNTPTIDPTKAQRSLRRPLRRDDRASREANHAGAARATAAEPPRRHPDRARRHAPPVRARPPSAADPQRRRRGPARLDPAPRTDPQRRHRHGRQPDARLGRVHGHERQRQRPRQSQIPRQPPRGRGRRAGAAARGGAAGFQWGFYGCAAGERGDVSAALKGERIMKLVSFFIRSLRPLSFFPFLALLVRCEQELS